MDASKRSDTNTPSNRPTRISRKFSSAPRANRKSGRDVRPVLSAVSHIHQPAEGSVEAAQKAKVSDRRHRGRALFLLLLLPILVQSGTQARRFVSVFW